MYRSSSYFRDVPALSVASLLLCAGLLHGAKPLTSSSSSAGQLPQHSPLQQALLQRPLPQQPVLQPMSQQNLAQKPAPQQSVSQQPLPQKPLLQQTLPQQSEPHHPLPQQPVPQQPETQQRLLQQRLPQHPLPHDNTHVGRFASAGRDESLVNPDREISLPGTGIVRGKVVKLDNVQPYDPWTGELTKDKYAVEFLGIPYAHPPRGSRRFAAPERKTWESVEEQRQWQREYGTPYPGMRWQPACTQALDPAHRLRVLALSGTTPDGRPRFPSDDCLYLNVFTPFFKDGEDKPCEQQDGSVQQKCRYPVIVHLHGDNFTRGAAQLYPGHRLAERGAVVVTFNYRLGPLGFLTIGTADAPGNYGFLDQVLALEFVKRHIISFRGDPARITVYGHGSGAAMVGLHMLSPRSHDLFSRAVASSGAEVAQWASFDHIEQAKNITREFSKRIGCTWIDDKSLMDCLKARGDQGAAEFSQVHIESEYQVRPAWAPVIDGLFEPPLPPGASIVFPNTTLALLQQVRGRSPVPYMVGVNRDDGSKYFWQQELGEHPTEGIDPGSPLYRPHLEVREGLPVEVDRAEFEARIVNLTWRQNLTTDHETRQLIIHTLAQEYTPWAHPTRLRHALTQMYTDLVYVAPAALSASLRVPRRYEADGGATDANGVYVYCFDYRSRRDIHPNWTGVSYGKEEAYVWGIPWYSQAEYPRSDEVYGVRWSDMDRNVSLLMMEMWLQFSRWGRPTRFASAFPAQFINTTWPPFAIAEPWYLSVNETPIHLRDFFSHKAAFWNEYVPGLADIDLPIKDKYWYTNYYASYNVATWSLEAISMLILMGVLIMIGLILVDRGIIRRLPRVRLVDSRDRIYLDDFPDSGAQGHLKKPLQGQL